MAIVTSSNKSNQINQSNLNQLDSVFSTPDDKKATEETKITAKASETQEIELKTKKAPAKKRDNSDTLLLNLPKGERGKFKSFCALNEITMTDFIYFSMDFVKDMVDQGKCIVGRSGIKVISQD